LVYTAIFQDDGGRFTYDIYNAPHGCGPRAWALIQEEGQKNGNRYLIAIVPGSHQVGFYCGPSAVRSETRAEEMSRLCQQP